MFSLSLCVCPCLTRRRSFALCCNAPGCSGFQTWACERRQPHPFSSRGSCACLRAIRSRLAFMWPPHQLTGVWVVLALGVRETGIFSNQGEQSLLLNTNDSEILVVIWISDGDVWRVEERGHVEGVERAQSTIMPLSNGTRRQHVSTELPVMSLLVRYFYLFDVFSVQFLCI